MDPGTATAIAGNSASTSASEHSGEPAKTDGRHARRERGRLAAIDATFELIAEGHTPPSAQQVAERAGISTSSLFRYFETLSEMQLEALNRFAERYVHLITDPPPPHLDPGTASVAERVAAFVAARVELFSKTASLVALAERRSLDTPAIARGLHRQRSLMADQVRRWFGPELDRADASVTAATVAVIDSIASSAGYRLFTEIHHCDRDAIATAWRRSILSVVTTAAVAP